MGEKLNIGKFYFCPAEYVGTENEIWKEGELKSGLGKPTPVWNGLASTEKIEVCETIETEEKLNAEAPTEWKRSFSFSIDCPIEGDVEKLFRSLTSPRKKRKGERQRRKEIRKWRLISGLRYYLKKIFGPNPRRTIFDVRRENELRKLWEIPF